MMNMKKAIVVAKTEEIMVYPGDEIEKNIGIPYFKWVEEKDINVSFVGIAAEHLKEGDVVLASIT